jgi:hypothetical protein
MEPYISDLPMVARLGLLAGLLGLSAYFLVQITRRKKHSYPLPPSPPSEAILGHLRLLPLENVHLKHWDYAKQFGEEPSTDICKPLA